MKRFEREAQDPASLNHPNVAAIYGVEDPNWLRALVLELVERPTDRRGQGPKGSSRLGGSGGASTCTATASGSRRSRPCRKRKDGSEIMSR
jgi:hypothetical protein